MNKVKNVIISYWYKELKTNPIDNIKELEEIFNSTFKTPFIVNDLPIHTNLSVPRIEAITENNNMLFNLSLINANVSIKIDDMDNDDVILLINEKVQLFFDILKDIYSLEIIYTSIKLELIEVIDNANAYLTNILNLNDDDYEDIMLKKSIKKDNTYYINYIISSNKEVNFNLEFKGFKPTQNDIIDCSMLMSLKDGKIINNFVLTVIEVNDRLSYNNSNTYLTTKENIRGMIAEIKDILINKKSKLL